MARLRISRYFGQYGKILKIALSPGAATPPGTSAPPAHSCYITYANREEAEQAILAVDGVVLDGRTLKASFGTPMRYAQLSDELGFSRDLDDTAAIPEHSKASEASSMQSSGPAPMPGPACAPTAALAPPPASPAALPPGTSAVRARCLTAGPTASSAAVGCGAFARATGRRSSIPERGNGAAEGGSVEFLTPVSGCRQSVPSAHAVSSQDRGTLDLAPLDSQSPAVKAQSPLPSPGGDSFSWAPHSLGELPRGTSSTTEFAALGSVEGSGAVGGGALVGGSAASPRMPRATGSSGFEFGDSEPWSMMGSFEVLLSGSLPDEVEEETTPLTSSSRFARFFDADDAAGSKPNGVFSAGLGAGGVHGSGLDGGVGSGIGGDSKLLDDDWQQGFRALLPDVNISFSSPFGDRALSGANPSAQQLGRLGGGLGGGGIHSAGSFIGFGSSRVDGPQQNATSGVGNSSCTVGLGGGSGNGGGSSLLNGSLHHAALNGVALQGLAGDSGGATNTLLQQLSVGSLPGAQLSTTVGPEVSGAELSSQLHSLLRCGGGGGSSSSSGGAAAAAGGSGAGGSGDGTAPLNAMQRPQLFMPGWLPTVGLLAEKPDSCRDTAAPGGRAARERRSAGHAAGSGSDNGANGANGSGIGIGDRGSKAKKRGGTNRGSKGVEPKPVAVHK
jgi:hypothetical protein